MHLRTLLGIILMLAGCGLDDAVVIEVDVDPRFMGQIDRLELAQAASPSAGFASSLTGNPVALPASFTIKLDDVRATVEKQGGLSRTARAWWKTVEIGQGTPSEPDTVSGWVTFHHSPVKLTLTTRSLDILRHCESDVRCATGYCGNKRASSPARPPAGPWRLPTRAALASAKLQAPFRPPPRRSAPPLFDSIASPLGAPQARATTSLPSLPPLLAVALPGGAQPHGPPRPVGASASRAVRNRHPAFLSARSVSPRLQPRGTPTYGHSVSLLYGSPPERLSGTPLVPRFMQPAWLGD